MIANFYTDSAVVKRSSKTSDGAGGVTTATTTVGTVLGRLNPVSGNNQIFTEKETLFSTHIFYCGPDSGIQFNDSVTISSVEYRAIMVKNPFNTSHHLEVYLQQIL